MRITKGKVIGGHIVVEDEPLTEGAVVTVLVSDERTFTLSDEDEAALLEAIREADRGELLDAEDVLKRLAQDPECCQSRSLFEPTDRYRRRQVGGWQTDQKLPKLSKKTFNAGSIQLSAPDPWG